MLVENNKINVGDVVSFKISSGEELVAKIASITPEEYILNRPLALGMGPKGPIFTPYMVTVDFKKEDLHLSKNHVVAVSKTVDQITNSYIQSISGIAMPEKPGIIT